MLLHTLYLSYLLVTKCHGHWCTPVSRHDRSFVIIVITHKALNLSDHNKLFPLTFALSEMNPGRDRLTAFLLNGCMASSLWNSFGQF